MKRKKQIRNRIKKRRAQIELKRLRHTSKLEPTRTSKATVLDINRVPLIEKESI